MLQSECQEIVLASSSPRRAELLARAGLPFRVVVVPIDEEARPWEKPEELAVRLALEKARATARKISAGLVLGADTVVSLDDHVLGKPRDAAEAATMLRALRGRQHRVITGLTLVDARSGRYHTESVTTRVWMRPYSDTELAAYVASGEPMDKAGAYAIQSSIARLVERIMGCYTNVVGLPLCAVARALTALGCTLRLTLRPEDVDIYADCPDCRRLRG
ncbi:MAG: septum formation inhibitor Maf [Chloroflexota bacterium]|nr:MAG: septum formation inhibitor Maf [Chloroflexota bacterium]